MAMKDEWPLRAQQPKPPTSQVCGEADAATPQTDSTEEPVVERPPRFVSFLVSVASRASYDAGSKLWHLMVPLDVLCVSDTRREHGRGLRRLQPRRLPEGNTMCYQGDQMYIVCAPTDAGDALRRAMPYVEPSAAGAERPQLMRLPSSSLHVELYCSEASKRLMLDVDADARFKLTQGVVKKLRAPAASPLLGLLPLAQPPLAWQAQVQPLCLQPQPRFVPADVKLVDNTLCVRAQDGTWQQQQPPTRAVAAVRLRMPLRQVQMRCFEINVRAAHVGGAPVQLLMGVDNDVVVLLPDEKCVCAATDLFLSTRTLFELHKLAGASSAGSA